MLVKKSLSFKAIMQFAGGHLIWLAAWMGLVTTVYDATHWRWMSIPWLPLSVIGTAVAFYVGFKNNQAYDRLWEARKIWGAIINSSRSWGAMVKAYIRGNNPADPDLQPVKKKLIYRHIAWVYTLRQQLLVPTQWEHVSLRHQFGKLNRKRRAQYGAGLFEGEAEKSFIHKYITTQEYNENTGFANTATHIIDTQSQELARLNEAGSLDMLRQIELQRTLNELYDHQGRAERIKKFPLPRQYAHLSFIFVCIFIFLLPFGVVGEFSKLGSIGIWLTLPFGVLVGWVYVVMELIGDYSENPFEGLANDVPMLSICRTIEIDLLQMLGETDLPPVVQPKNGVLM